MTATSVDAVSLFCARCAAELFAGTGSFYQVTIEAVADPSPPALEDTAPEDLRRQIEALIERLGEVSEREAMDQVRRRLVIHLCNACYRTWIENPAR